MEIGPAVEFIVGTTRGVLLTIKPDGRPHASNVTYAVFDDAVHVSVTDSRVKTANLRRDSRVSLYVGASDFWRWVVVEGDAILSPVVARPDDAVAGLLRRYYETAAGPHPDWDEFDSAMIEERRMVVSFRPDAAYGQLG